MMNRDRTAHACRAARWSRSIPLLAATVLMLLAGGPLVGTTFAGAASKTTYRTVDTKAARVGTTLYVKTPGGQDESATLVKVFYPAGGSASRAEYGEGYRLVALLVKIANMSSRNLAIDSRSNATTLYDSTNEAHETLFSSVKECRTYPAVLKISPDRAASGCYVFSIPSGVRAKELELYPEAGYWRISSGSTRRIAGNAIPDVVEVPNVIGLTVAEATQICKAKA